MVLDEQIQEVSSDIDEIKRLIDQTTRRRIKQNLELQYQKFEKEVSQLQEKQQKQATAQTEAKPVSASALPTTAQAYTKEVSVYAWDQSDKFVKVYVQNLDGVESLPENHIQCSFDKRGFHLQIQNLKNINYSLKRARLLHDIQQEQSTFKVKKDMVILSLRKVESKNWECLLQDEKKTPIKPLPNLDKAGGSNELFMDAVEEMYETGDDATKRAIAQAWVKSRERMNTVGTKQDDGMDSNILRTSDFTLYPPPRK